jgi:hypothetical protein
MSLFEPNQRLSQERHCGVELIRRRRREPQRIAGELQRDATPSALMSGDGIIPLMAGSALRCVRPRASLRFEVASDVRRLHAHRVDGVSQFIFAAAELGPPGAHEG